MKNFDSLMKELRKEYVEDLPGRIKEIEQNFSEQKVEILRDDFHKLKGTGSTYGIPEISELGAVIEQICLQHPAAVDNALPQAIDLLRLIHQEREQEREFDIVSDNRFGELKRICEV